MTRPSTLTWGIGAAWLLMALACDASPQSPSPQSVPSKKTRIVHGELPVAAFVSEQLLHAADGGKMVVYAGATWCEPCQRFHRALEAGELDSRLGGVTFIEYDYDVARDALVADGYASRLIPLFALPGPDGRASGRVIEGSIKGDGAVANILPRLAGLLAGK